jgi:hypothetical protein
MDMSPRVTSIALVVAVLGTGAFAVLHADSTPPPRPETSRVAPEPHDTAEMDNPPALPPGHPSIGAAGLNTGAAGMNGAPQGAAFDPPSDAPSVTWKVPSAWTAVANPSPMRLATYRVPHAPGDTDSADVSVTRAGGSPDANIERWLGQFDNRGKETRTERDVRGLKVTIVEVSGTYLGGGMMMAGPSTPHTNWALLGAIIEASGTPYFVKITGPVATVRSARGPLNALLDSLTPS